MDTNDLVSWNEEPTVEETRRNLVSLIYGNEEPTVEETRRKYLFEELVPTQPLVFRHRLWKAQRRYKKGTEVPDIIVLPATKISQMLHNIIQDYPLLDGEFYIWDGHARTIAAKMEGKDSICGRWATGREINQEDMLGTVFDQIISLLYMTRGTLGSIDNTYIEKGCFIRDYFLSLKD